MPLDYARLRSWSFPDVVHRYGATQSILYALGVGYGDDPTDAQQLRFLYEEGLTAVPTMAVVLGYPGAWIREAEIGIDWRRVLHGEQAVTLHRPLPSAGEVIGRTAIENVIDQGAGRGALIYSRREVIDRASGELLATLASTSFCRGEGGFGGPRGPLKPLHQVPQRSPDALEERRTSPRAALIYRLSGDLNPLHIDPATAHAAGFARPILHGLATFGVAGHALLKALCGYEVGRFRHMEARFSAVVFPGESILTEIWHTAAGQAAFQCRVLARDVIVLSNGYAEYAA